MHSYTVGSLPALEITRKACQKSPTRNMNLPPNGVLTYPMSHRRILTACNAFSGIIDALSQIKIGISLRI